MILAEQKRKEDRDKIISSLSEKKARNKLMQYSYLRKDLNFIYKLWHLDKRLRCLCNNLNLMLKSFHHLILYGTIEKKRFLLIV